MNQINPISTENTKQHFKVLDGLRGVAAIAVVLFHFMEFVYPDISKNFIGHGFLAVDFFFCLSGFVIAYAYDHRIASMGVTAFFKLRLIRLHPLVLLSAILGLLAFFITWDNGGKVYDWITIGLSFISSALLIPLPIMTERGFSLIAFNSPAWSLFFEYMANVVYAFFLYKISNRNLILCIILSIVALVAAGYHAGILIGGWDGKSFLDGLARVSFSFMMGLLLYRFRWIISSSLGFVSLSLLLLLTFMLPFFSINWLTEVLVIVVIYPLLIALGAGTHVNAKIGKVCSFLGDLSYPLYMTHYALLWFFVNYYTKYHPESWELFFIVSGGTLVMIGFAYLVLKVYDLPLRRYLSSNKTGKN
ncbi:MAG: acyltransferase 3 [Cytophagaceae bacterium]|nr:acyltransferase 3 [Cytophagaceae bacterium]